LILLGFLPFSQVYPTNKPSKLFAFGLGRAIDGRSRRVFAQLESDALGSGADKLTALGIVGGSIVHPLHPALKRHHRRP
jgi:hypothetical protein